MHAIRKETTHIRYATWARHRYQPGLHAQELLETCARMLGDTQDQKRIEALAIYLGMPGEIDPHTLQSKRGQSLKGPTRLSIAN